MRIVLSGLAKNAALFYGTYFAVTLASIYFLIGGLEGLARSGLIEVLPQLVTFLAPAAVASSLASLLIREPRARFSRVLVSGIAAATSYAAVAAVGVSVAAPGMEGLFASPLYITNFAAIVSGLLFGAVARPVVAQRSTSA